MAQYRPHVDWDQKPDLGHKYPRYKMRKRKGKWVYVYEKEIDPETGEAKRNPKTGRIVYKRDSRGRKVRIPTDRRAILAHMHKRIEAKGLFRPAPLERKKPDSKPVVVAMTSAADAAP